MLPVREADGSVAIHSEYLKDAGGICTSVVLLPAWVVANFRASTTADGRSLTVIRRVGECILIKPRIDVETSWMSGVSEKPLWIAPTYRHNFTIYSNSSSLRVNDRNANAAKTLRPALNDFYLYLEIKHFESTRSAGSRAPTKSFTGILTWQEPSTTHNQVSLFPNRLTELQQQWRDSLEISHAVCVEKRVAALRVHFCPLSYIAPREKSPPLIIPNLESQQDMSTSMERNQYFFWNKNSEVEYISKLHYFSKFSLTSTVFLWITVVSATWARRWSLSPQVSLSLGSTGIT